MIPYVFTYIYLEKTKKEDFELRCNFGDANVHKIS